MKKLCQLSAVLGVMLASSTPSLATGSAPNSSPQAALTETVLATARLSIPFGQSIWAVSFSQAIPVGPLKLTWAQSPYCGGFKANVDLFDDRNQSWSPTRFENGTFIPSIRATSYIRIFVDQTALSQALCDVQVRSVGSDGTPTTPGSGIRTLAGVIDYAGGFVPNARVTLTQAVQAQRFEVFVPTYCEGLEVIEASVLQGETRVKASVSATRPLTLTLPAPMTFNAVELSLIGPQGRSCQLPVYTYALPAPAPAPTPTPTVRLEFDHETFDVDALDMPQ
jgi:hypothetical protein